jgi:DNA-binding response OmpR family regulator
MDLPKILIVDDREFDRILYQEYLGSANYVFSELEDGESILQHLSEFKPNLILLDWQMPKVGGLDTLKMLKKNNLYNNIPIIIITGLQDENVLEEAFDYGSIDFLNKPVSKIELTARVHSAIRLNEAKQMLLMQRQELLELNKIIQSQKGELEKSLEIKSQQLDTNEEEHQKNINEVKRKLMTLELDNTKVSNHLKAFHSSLEECYNELRSENNESLVLRKLRQLMRNVQAISLEDQSWTEFKEVFESLDHKFFDKLNERNPKLTSLDLKHCAYIKMNLDNYEVANIFNVELKSLQMTRYRLKKKLALGSEESLREFLMKV